VKQINIVAFIILIKLNPIDSSYKELMVVIKRGGGGSNEEVKYKDDFNKKKMLDNKKEKDWLYLLVFSIQKVRFNKIFN